MRFAIKTSPQDTTFADMLSVWQAADDIDVSSRVGRSHWTTSVAASASSP